MGVLDEGPNPVVHVGMHDAPCAMTLPEQVAALVTEGKVQSHVNDEGLIVFTPLHTSAAVDEMVSIDPHAGVHEVINFVIPSPHAVAPTTVGGVHSGIHVNVPDSPMSPHVMGVLDEARYPLAHVGMHDAPCAMTLPEQVAALVTEGKVQSHVNDEGLIVFTPLHTSAAVDEMVSIDPHAGVHEVINFVVPSPHAVAPTTVGGVHSGVHVNVVDGPDVPQVIAIPMFESRYPEAHDVTQVAPCATVVPLHDAALATVGSTQLHEKVCDAPPTALQMMSVESDATKPLPQFGAHDAPTAKFWLVQVVAWGTAGSAHAHENDPVGVLGVVQVRVAEPTTTRLVPQLVVQEVRKAAPLPQLAAPATTGSSHWGWQVNVDGVRVVPEHVKVVTLST